METVSVLVPTYNRKVYIFECIKSILSQSYKDIFLIVYDDGSVDNTYNLISNFLKGTNLKYQLMRSEQNKGVGYARNVLLKEFKTPYACWLDSDDVMHPDRIIRQLNFLKNNGADICFSTIGRFITTPNKLIGINKIDVSKYSDYNSLRGNTVNATGLFRSDLKEFRFKDEIKVAAEDCLWLYSLIKAHKKIVFLDEILYYYRIHPQRTISRLKKDPKLAEQHKKENLILQQEIVKLDG